MKAPLWAFLQQKIRWCSWLQENSPGCFSKYLNKYRQKWFDLSQQKLNNNFHLIDAPLFDVFPFEILYVEDLVFLGPLNFSFTTAIFAIEYIFKILCQNWCQSLILSTWNFLNALHIVLLVLEVSDLELKFVDHFIFLLIQITELRLSWNESISLTLGKLTGSLGIQVTWLFLKFLDLFVKLFDEGLS